MNQNLQLISIPALTAAACVFYAIKLLVFKDTNSIRGNMSKKLKNKDAYARYAGILLLVFGACSAIMAALLFVNIKLALIQMIISVIITAMLWCKVEKEYGAVD